MNSEIRTDLIKKHFPAIIALIIIATIYILFMAETVGYGDGLGFLITVMNGYEPATNATGHFLYVNIMSFFVHNLPGGTLILKCVLFSILFSVLTLIQVYRTCNLLTTSRIAALASTVLLALSFTYWRQTEIIEVYMFNNFFFATLLFYVLEDLKTGTNKNNIKSSIVLGLSLLGHIQNLLLGLFFLYYLILTNGVKAKPVIKSGFIVGGIASLLILIPLIFNTNSIQSVFFQNDLFQSKATDYDFYMLFRGFAKSIVYLLYNFLFFIPFLIHGAWLQFKENKKHFMLFMLAILPFWAFAAKYDVPDNYVFFLQAYIILVILSTKSFTTFISVYPKVKRAIVPAIFILLPLTYFSAWKTAKALPQLRELDSYKSYKGGVKYLTWPGMKDTGDLLETTKEIYLTGKKPPAFQEFKWTYDQALIFLISRGEIPENPENIDIPEKK